jgi:hypothetical protein
MGVTGRLWLCELRGKYLKHVIKYRKNFGTCVMRNSVECGCSSKNKNITLQSEGYYDVCHKLCVKSGMWIELCRVSFHKQACGISRNTKHNKNRFEG